MRAIGYVRGVMVVAAALTIACGSDSQEDFPGLGDPVGLRHDASALPSDAEMRSFAGAYRLTIQFSSRCVGKLPLTAMTFDVDVRRSLENWPQGIFGTQPGGDFDDGDGGFVMVRPEGLNIDFTGAWVSGTPYTVVSSWTAAREGDFTIAGSRGRFVGKTDLPNLTIVQGAPPATEWKVWECEAVDHAVTFLPR